MYYIVETQKSFAQAVTDLEAAVKQNGFGVMHIHDLAGTLHSKGFEFAEECKVFEICHPGHASKVLAADIRLNMALPCRISVYTEKGKTQIGMIKPAPMLMGLSSDEALAQVAKEVEEKITKMINDAK
jgi:uncharacterized protein (DUF302 family)